MRVLADHCIPPSLVHVLRENGINVIRLLEKRLQKASDEAVFNFAFKNSLVLLTFDHDFGNITRFNIRRSRGVVIVYVERMTKAVIFRRTVEFFKNTKGRKLGRRLFIIEPEGTRIWPK